MVLRRNDARRRRLVIDPTAPMGDVDLQVADESSAPPRRKGTDQLDARTYSYGADRRSQRKTTDLIPKRIVSYLLVVLALLTCLWLINFTSVRAHQWSGQIGQAGMDALAIRGEGSFASWFSSFLLIMTGMASLQIYALRRHRCDDYRGTYRLWLWMAGLLIVASINCVTDLGAIASNLSQAMLGESHTPRAWVPLAFQLAAITLLMARGAYEVRQSKGSFALVAFVWVAYSVASVLKFPASQESLVSLGSDTMIGNCILWGTAALFLAHLTFARYIFLDAHGLIVPRVSSKTVAKKEKTVRTKTAKPKRAKKTKPSEAERTAETAAKVAASQTPTRKKRKSKVVKQERKAEPQTTKNAEPQTTKKSDKSPSEVLRALAAASRAKEQTQSSSTNQSAFSDEEDGVVRMSKSQRRRQRKLDKQQRRAA